MIVAVISVMVGFIANLTGVLFEKEHRIILSGPPTPRCEIIGDSLAKKFNATVINASSFDKKSSSSSWILRNDDCGKFLSETVRHGEEFAKVLGRPTHIVLFEYKGDADESPCDYNESTSRWMREMEASFGPVPVIRVDASKTPEDVYAEIQRRGFLEFYSKFSRCGSLCRAY